MIIIIHKWYKLISLIILLGTTTKNNQISIPSGPNIQHTPETRPSIIITNNGYAHSLIFKIIIIN